MTVVQKNVGSIPCGGFFLFLKLFIINIKPLLSIFLFLIIFKLYFIFYITQPEKLKNWLIFRFRYTSVNCFSNTVDYVKTRMKTIGKLSDIYFLILNIILK